MTGFLEQDLFSRVVASTPLISIDLILKAPDSEILLGERLNRPAQGFWFVPGGRIFKNESLDDAFLRITHIELGLSFKRSCAQFLGIYEHFYDDSQFGGDQQDSSTHYVVLAYVINVPSKNLISPPKNQHGQYSWWSLINIENSQLVHRHTRDYIKYLTI